MLLAVFCTLASHKAVMQFLLCLVLNGNLCMVVSQREPLKCCVWAAGVIATPEQLAKGLRTSWWVQVHLYPPHGWQQPAHMLSPRNTLMHLDVFSA
jgi:hypothetical protein